MPDPTQRVLPASYYFGAVLARTYEGGTTADVFETVNAMREAAGATFPSNIATEISRYRSQAVSMRTAMENLMAAPADYGVTSAMIQRPFYGRPPELQEAAPIFNVRFETVVQRGTETVHEWRTIQLSDLSEMTIEDLLAEIADFGQDIADRYGGELLSVPRYSIEAV